MFIAASIAAALSYERAHFSEFAASSEVHSRSASLFVEDWESAEEHRCFDELIDFLVNRGAARRYE
jgi:hypothetical protein